MMNGNTPLVLVACFALPAGWWLSSPPPVEAEDDARKSAPAAKTSEPEVDPTVLQDQATQVLDTYCVSCHGPKKQNGDVRLDALETIDAVDRQTLFGDAKVLLQLGEMPPEKAKQPSEAERRVLMQWLDRHLTGEAARALAEKLERFEYGNVVSHEDLFSGEFADLPGSTPDRRWLISEYVFNEKVNRLLDYHPTRTIYGSTHRVAGDSGVHWSPKTERGNKFRRTISNPFLLPENSGVRYSAHEALTAGHLLTMIGNAGRIAGHMSSEGTMKARYPAMHALMKTELEHREVLRSRERFLTTYTYMDRLLEDVFGDQHETLLPEIQRVRVAYPGPKLRNGEPTKREENLGLIDRMDRQDVEAVYRGLAAHRQADFEVVAAGPPDDAGYVTYSKPSRDAYEEIVLRCEREWFTEGVPDRRIRNRITTMKVFYDQWDLAGIYEHVQNGGYGRPEYVPLDDAEMEVIVAAIEKHRRKGDRYREIVDKCMADWRASFRAEHEAAIVGGDERVRALVVELYDAIFEREPTAVELDENVALFESYRDKLEMQPAIAKLIESLILSTEFAYRDEFGAGEADEHGRRMMSPRDASYALAYALTDSSPDDELAKAVLEGRLSTREDYEREVRRMLARRDLWTIVDEGVQAANLNASVTNQPIRKLRFFRDFFGYAKAIKVFKDDQRFGAGRHEPAVSRLIDEADLLVEHVLARDENVFEELLTTDRFYVYHSGDNAAMKAGSDQMKRVYDHFKDLDWQEWETEDVAEHQAFLLEIWEFQKAYKGSPKNLLSTLKRLMPQLELHFAEGQSNGMPYMKLSMGFWHGGNVVGRTGQQMRGEQVASYWNLDWRTWDYPTEQPATIPNRKGLLTHPAWLIAHAQNLETDPIHRGKWIREKLLAGTIPDVPITVDAVIHPDKDKTLRQRMEVRTGDAYCWRCHQKMDPLGFPFESFDDFGRFRTEENLEHEENLVKPAVRGETNEFGASLPVYKTLPVDPRGVLKGTGDPSLDGDVDDAFDLIDRLAKSDKVRQSIIRHAFRYFTGRNETLSDSKTLMDAEKAYLESNGSFDEVIVSLLTSDSFVYRTSNTKD